MKHGVINHYFPEMSNFKPMMRMFIYDFERHPKPPKAQREFLPNINWNPLVRRSNTSSTSEVNLRAIRKREPCV